jgi:biopolymer transport protein ExbD
MKKLRRKKKTSIKLDVAPLIDVMFMLLLFFLLTSSFLNPNIVLNLPEASSNKKNNKQDIIVSIDKNENIYINRDLIKLEDLKLTLTKKIKSSLKKKVIFHGDENILYKKFVNILDIATQSGAMEVSIAHKKK